MEIGNWTRHVDWHAPDLWAALAESRARERSLVVTLETQPDHPPHIDATQYKVYPSGKILWAFDGANPFQTWD